MLTRPTKCPRSPPAASQRPALHPGSASIHPRRTLTRRHNGSLTFILPAFPLPAPAQWITDASASSLSFTPCRYQQRMSERGQAYRTLTWATSSASPGWAELCERTFGGLPSQICFDWNTPQHTTDDAMPPTRRALTIAELQFLRRRRRRGRCCSCRGPQRWLTHFRDSIAFTSSVTPTGWASTPYPGPGPENSSVDCSSSTEPCPAKTPTAPAMRTGPPNPSTV